MQRDAGHFFNIFKENLVHLLMFTCWTCCCGAAYGRADSSRSLLISPRGLSLQSSTEHKYLTAGTSDSLQHNLSCREENTIRLMAFQRCKGSFLLSCGYLLLEHYLERDRKSASLMLYFLWNNFNVVTLLSNNTLFCPFSGLGFLLFTILSCLGRNQ